MSAKPILIDSAWPGDQYVQVVPVTGVDRYAGIGQGVRSDSVRVVVFKRLFSDVADSSSERIAGATSGLLALIDTIDAKLANNFLDGILVHPLIPQRRESTGLVQSEETGWSVIERLYAMQYRVDYAAPQEIS